MKAKAKKALSSKTKPTSDKLPEQMSFDQEGAFGADTDEGYF